MIYNMDCLEGMNRISDASIDLILCDLPYGTTRNKWDEILPFETLWIQYRRVIKDHGAIVLFADGLFTAKLILSNVSMWRYNLIWDKQRGCDFLNANVKPLKSHEDICVFYKKKSLFTINRLGIVRHINAQRTADCPIITDSVMKRGQNQRMVNGIPCLFFPLHEMGNAFIRHRNPLIC